MKNYFPALLVTVLTVIFFSCNRGNKMESSSQTTAIIADSIAPITISSEKLDSIVNLIVDISATDFYKNQQPAPTNFENVKLKYIKKQNGEELYILCGQFSTKDSQEIQFATVKNSDYEQWVGVNALTYCQDSQVIPYSKMDLSTALKSKFDSLKR